MTAPLPHRVKGWCPGALRPMRTGDGLLVRLRIAGGLLPAATLAVIGRLAARHGNGLVDQSQRANLQLRGVTEASLPALHDDLAALGLLDADPDAEAIRNVVASPLAGLDPKAPVDGRRLAAALEAELGGAADLRALPGKFGFVVDQGGALSLDAVAVDIRLTGRPDGRVALAFGGSAVDAVPAAIVPSDRAAAAAVAGARAYLALRRPDERRLKPLVARIGADAIVRVAFEGWPAGTVEPIAPSPGATAPTGSTVGPTSTPDPAASSVPVPAPGWHSVPGAADGRGFALVAPALGRWEADQLVALAAMAQRFGAAEIRLTPWRMVLLPGVAEPDAAPLAAAARAAGLVTDAADPRLAVVACAGAPGCESGLQPSRADALALAEAAAALPGAGVRLHVSGCPKGCARPEPTAVTLVGTPAGYDAVLGGTAADAPRFGGLPAKEALARAGILAQNEYVTNTRPDSPAPTSRPIRLAVPERATRASHIRDGQAIYDRSFAIIRAEADLARFTAEEEQVAVRIIHACGMVEIAEDVLFAPGAVLAARAALRAGAPILCDAKMVANGVTKARLPAGNEVVCTLDDPRVPDIARRIGNTRTAAAMELWRDRLGGAVVAIGNAPTALFRLLDLLDEGVPPPAAVIGMPVGFVGAAESKDALMEDGRVPWLVVRGRRGGSAMTAAAINAVASERE